MNNQACKRATFCRTNTNLCVMNAKIKNGQWTFLLDTVEHTDNGNDGLVFVVDHFRIHDVFS